MRSFGIHLASLAVSRHTQTNRTIQWNGIYKCFFRLTKNSAKPWPGILACFFSASFPFLVCFSCLFPFSQLSVKNVDKMAPSWQLITKKYNKVFPETGKVQEFAFKWLFFTDSCISDIILVKFKCCHSCITQHLIYSRWHLGWYPTIITNLVCIRPCIEVLPCFPTLSSIISIEFRTVIWCYHILQECKVCFLCPV